MEVFLPRDRPSSKLRGFAFVRMGSEEELARAVRLLHCESFGGRKFLVQRARLYHLLMAGHDGQNEHEWIERVKSEGAVPLLQPDNCPDGWASPPGDKFMVRGPNYFTDRVKIPGGNYLLKPLGFDWIKGATKISDVLNHPNSRVRKAIDNEFAIGKKPFIWAFNLQVPSKDNYSAVAYFVALDPIPEGSLMDRFLKGDDAFRNSRLKLIANIVKGPWIVRTAVGEQAICILGRAVSCKYFIRENYIEVDVDIGASMVANAIVHLAFGYITTLTVDLAFLIEGQTELELPERILGAVRFSELNPASARPIEPPSDENSGNPQSSLPTRLWKSIGQGFSHLLQNGVQEGSASSSAHVNGSALDFDGDGVVKK
ncbi:protein ENHANCED DISEASE RESISTANCE 2-like isoform X2 [Magnolia sinica]|nr:protein ENHANCED DISEASE RESISTANCE 2-like isoform X2 [Magnolia sinica]